MKPTVKIYGYGWVGKAMHPLFPDAIIHERSNSWKRVPQGIYNYSKEEEPKCDVAFVCVPTDLKEDGTLDCSIVEDIVKNSPEDFFIIRSTVMPGFSDYLANEYGKSVVFMPEYIGETVAHPLFDETKRPFLIIGGEPEWRRAAIELFTTVYNSNIRIRQVTNLEAEVIKLSENRSIAFKVSEIQELYDACEAASACEAARVDFYTVREAVYGDDPRMNLWWSFVFPDNRGFQSSKCLRKDVPAFCAWAESCGFKPEITKLLVTKSRQYESERDNPVA